MQTPETDPHYGFAYAKVQLKGTSFLEENAKNSGAASGVFIDVFPLDYLPNEKRAQKKLWTQLKVYKVLLLCKNKYKYAGKKSVVKRIAFWGIRVYSLFFSREKIVKKLNEVVKKFNLIETDTYVNLFGAYELGREIFPRADVDLSKDILFENVFLRGPSNEKEFLSNLYGDYMQLPPEDKRYNRHNAVRLSFGEYAEIDIQ